MTAERTNEVATVCGRARTVVVTGANGFLGRHVCAELLRRGWMVRAVVRSASAVLPDGVQRIVQHDLTDEERLTWVFASAWGVVHLAGRAHVLRRSRLDADALFHASNVLPTIACAQAARRAGVTSFVFMSSVAAVAGNDDGPISDDTRPRPVNAYGRSKLAAERALAAATATSAMGVVSLRPPMIYGPGMRGNPLRLFRLVASGFPLPLGALRNARTIAFVGNVAAEVADVLASERRGAPRTYLVGDDEQLATAELIRHIAVVLGRPARLIAVPPPLLRVVARVGDAIGRLVPLPFDSAALGSLAGTLVLDTSQFRRDVGGQRQFSLEAGLLATARWFTSDANARERFSC